VARRSQRWHVRRHLRRSSLPGAFADLIGFGGSRGTAPDTVRAVVLQRPNRRGIAAIVFLVGSVGVATWLIAHHAAPDRVRKDLSHWLGAAVGSCASVTDDDVAASDTALSEIPLDFRRRARERAVIACEVAGPYTDYLRFADRRALLGATAANPDVIDLRPCLLDHEVFTGAGLTGAPLTRDTVLRWCRRLNGRMLTQRAG
jgi:hypothetical protein